MDLTTTMRAGLQQTAASDIHPCLRSGFLVEPWEHVAFLIVEMGIRDPGRVSDLPRFPWQEGQRRAAQAV